MPARQQINLQLMNQPHGGQAATTSGWVAVTHSTWGLHATVLAGIGAVSGMAVFTAAFLVPIMLTDSKYTPANITTATINTTTLSATTITDTSVSIANATTADSTTTTSSTSTISVTKQLNATTSTNTVSTETTTSSITTASTTTTGALVSSSIIANKTTISVTSNTETATTTSDTTIITSVKKKTTYNINITEATTAYTPITEKSTSTYATIPAISTMDITITVTEIPTTSTANTATTATSITTTMETVNTIVEQTITRTEAPTSPIETTTKTMVAATTIAATIITSTDTTAVLTGTAISATTASLPSFLDLQPDTIYGVWNTFAGGISTLATESSSGAGTYLIGQSPDKLFDGNLNTKYGSRGNTISGTSTVAGLNTGFYMTVAQCQPVLIGFRFGNAYNLSEREPLKLTIEGTNCANLTTCANWTLIYNGSTGLDIQASSLEYGQYQSISNSDIYKSYRFLITAKRNSSNIVSYSEVQLFGYSTQSSSSQNGTSNSTSLLVIQSGSVQSLWNTVAGGASTIATESSSGVGTYVLNQSPDNLFDNKTSTKYMSRGNSSNGTNAYAGLDTGFYVTIAQCQPTLVKFRFATAANTSSSSRDPTEVTVEGTNCDTLVNCATWASIYVGPTGLESIVDRSTYGPFQNISSPQIFTSYRFLVTAKRSRSDTVAYSEVELYGY
ncbi:unnamed protein product [Rotaria sp. Silwood2]|nr:unnamed protein product [Rotaria sp. Silwood2]